MQRTLQNKDSIILIPGGAAEALHTQHFSIKKRRGFLKLALETNSGLVPCIGFGENQAFDVWHASGICHTYMVKLQKLLSFAIPMLKSPFCRKVPIHVVVGEPIHLDPKLSLDDHEALYYQKLEELYNAHKQEYGHEHIPLTYVE